MQYIPENKSFLGVSFKEYRGNTLGKTILRYGFIYEIRLDRYCGIKEPYNWLKTLFHELGHIVLGHLDDAVKTDIAIESVGKRGTSIAGLYWNEGAISKNEYGETLSFISSEKKRCKKKIEERNKERLEMEAEEWADKELSYYKRNKREFFRIAGLLN